MDLRQTITEMGKTVPGQFEPQKDGSARMEAVIAERKAFLSKKKLDLHLPLQGRRAGQRSALLRDAQGIGLRRHKRRGQRRDEHGLRLQEGDLQHLRERANGSIEEQSKLFGKDYSYKFDFGTFRGAVRKAAEGAGYRFEVKLMEKSV